MAEKFSFFDPVLTESGLPDREYNAQEFTNYFEKLITTGVMKGDGNELKVTANGSNMLVSIDTGTAYILGRQYINTAMKDHTHDTESLGKDRIDRIVIRMDLNTDARYVKSFVKKGVASASPVAPALTRNETVYEISLAQVKVIGGQTYISASNMTDERGKEDVCPWAGSNILPNFNSEGLADLIAKVDNTMNAVTMSGSDADPNTTTDSLIVTNHANGPQSGQYYYVLTLFYSTRLSARGQLALQYTDGRKVYYRNSWGGVWSPWVEITIFDTGWINATLAAGWAHPSSGFLQYRKVGDLIYVRGKIMGINSVGTIITTLQAGYRPRGIAYLTTKFGHIYVTSTGAMFAGGGVQPNEDVYFDGVYSIV